MWIRAFLQHLWVTSGRTIIFSLGILISFWSRVDRIQDKLLMSRETDQSVESRTFDFIIVGAGSAGNVVAHRLSTNFTVLLLEAGGDPFPASDIPTFSLALLNYPEIDWMHQTVPQNGSCGALVNRQSGWSQGKGLGGTSNTNFLIHSRGHPKDFDNWAAITGDDRWNFEGVLPFFQRSEDYAGEDWQDTGAHGRGGPMRIETIPDKMSNGDVFLQAAQEMGYQKVDVNGRFTEGFDTITFPLKRGIRQSTFNAYIKPIRKRRNLTIRKFAHVNRILLRDGENSELPVAYGVEYDRHDQTFQAFARREVIISAGVQSPKIMMLSGIGPRTELEELGVKKIDVKVDSPLVGQQLQDHVSTYLGPFLVETGASVVVDRDLTVSRLVDYVQTGKGIYAQSGCQAIGFICSERQKAAQTQGEEPWPDIQYLFLGIHMYTDDGQDFARAFHIRRDVMKEYARRISSNSSDGMVDSFSIITSLARPKQRGFMRLRSSNPYDPLIIDPKYFQDDPSDIQILVEGAKKAVEMVETTDSFRKIGARFTDQPFPGCESEEFRSDAYFECYIRNFSVTLHHIVGTNSMGTKNVSEAVVDSELRVNGVQNLRIIDASVIPAVTVGNTNAPVIMVGERGAQFILDEYEK